MRWIKFLIKWIGVYLILPFFLIELILAVLVYGGVITLNPILVPSYLKVGKAKLTVDENGSPIYAGGWKKYFKTVFYDSNGFLIGDFDRLENGLENVLFLGDSYTEGLQVERHKTFTSLVNKFYPVKNIINLGVGGTGTIAQLLRYKTLRSKPNISDVLLFFLPQNDVLNNHRHFHKYGLPNAPYFSSSFDFEVISLEKNTNNIIYSLAKNIFSVRIVYNTYKKYYQKESLMENSTQKVDDSFFSLFKNRLVWFNVFNKPSSVIWKEAWRYTERSLLELKRMTTEDNVKLHIVIVADSLQIFNYKNPIHGYDFNYPNHRLTNFCKKIEINCYDSLPFFLEYLDKEKLVFPFFFV